MRPGCGGRTSSAPDILSMTSHNIKSLLRVRKVYMQYAVPAAARKNLFIHSPLWGKRTS